VPMPADLRQQLLLLNAPGAAGVGAGAEGGGELHQAYLASNALTRLYARAVDELLSRAQVRPSQVRAIGNHGQTVRHRPESPLGYTVQLGNHALLAEMTGIAVVADFRSRDVAAGGQGAPLVPAFHQALFGEEEGEEGGATADAKSPGLLVLNLGGIANVSWLRAGNRGVLGFDTGPANVLADLWIQAQKFPADADPTAASSTAAAASPAAPSSSDSAATLQYDASGRWGATGRVIPSLLEEMLLGEGYFALTPPKSTGRDLFSPAWIERFKVASYVDAPLDGSGSGAWTAADVMATLVELTARSVAEAIEKWCREEDKSTAGAQQSLAPLFVCGGGAHNTFLLSRLRSLLPGRSVQSTQESRGIGVESVEALAFAWLAHRFLGGLPGNLPAVTGAKGLRVLGAYYPA